MKTLSFVIPAYNSERFLDKCVTSMICEAVLDRLDIIVVNDGSTDQTPDIAQKYCHLYPESVRLISQENKGHGGALNAGCAAAKGKYLKVIDADDWVETDNLPAFLDMLDQCNSDVVLTHYDMIDISTGEVSNWKSYPQEFGVVYPFEDVMQQWKNFDRTLTFHGITYRTEFYQNNAIQLSEHVFYEDHEFATFPCCRAIGVMPFNLLIYHYRIGDVTQSVSDENQLRRVGHTATVLRRMVSVFLELGGACTDGGLDYARKKIHGLLVSYLSTSLLLNKNKKQGRVMARRMMAEINEVMPEVCRMTRKQYFVFTVFNCCRIGKKQFMAMLRSGLYNKIRGNRSFE